MIEVMILGPNLLDQSTGSFHVHRVGCADIKRRYPMALRTAESYTMPAECEQEVVESIYADFLDDGRSWNDYADDVRIFPCVTGRREWKR